MTTWAEVRLGDVLDVKGARWTVEFLGYRGGDGKMTVTLKSQSGVQRKGTPNPADSVTVCERGPEPEQVEASAVEALAPLQPEPLCGHWVGDEERYCGSDHSIRLFITGHRCPLHAPGLVQATAHGRRACASCGQPVPADAEPGAKCLACQKPIAKGKR